MTTSIPTEADCGYYGRGRGHCTAAGFDPASAWFLR
jgi:hypothetical protein